MLFKRATAWLVTSHLERRIALIALLFALPSLAVGLQSDDYLLHQQVTKDGPFAAYLFTADGAEASHQQALEQRSAGYVPWWTDEHPRARYFRPLSSLSLWLGFAHGAPPWWMHLENCAIYAVIAWLAAAIYRQLGLSGAGLGWAALFFGLDMAFAAPVGWIAARNTLLATCFGFACILLHDRARRSARPALLALASLCFALSLLSGELGLCTLGYLLAHALAVDRAPAWRRALALSPYAAILVLYLAHYVSADYGMSSSGERADVVEAPVAALLTWIQAIPVWLATTATLPVAGFGLVVPSTRLPILLGSLVVLTLLVPLLAAYYRAQLTAARTFGMGALLSLVPLATTMPQERLRFFVALGVYGLLGPWIARDYEAHGWARRSSARTVWAIHAVLLPLFFVPTLFTASMGVSSGGANQLDAVVARAPEPITIVLNPPSFYGPLYQAAMRAHQGLARPPLFMLYAGSQALEIERSDQRTLDLYAANSWFSSIFEGFRDLEHWPFHAGERIALAHLNVEVREVDGRGAPTRARFTFDRALEDPGLSFYYWDKSEIKTWTPPAIGQRLQLTAAAAF